MKVEKIFFYAFGSRIFPMKEKQGQGLKIAKAGNTSSKTFILCIEQKKLLKKQIAI